MHLYAGYSKNESRSSKFYGTQLSTQWPTNTSMQASKKEGSMEPQIHHWSESAKVASQEAGETLGNMCD